jgi:hypothetical protein
MLGGSSCLVCEVSALSSWEEEIDSRLSLRFTEKEKAHMIDQQHHPDLRESLNTAPPLRSLLPEVVAGIVLIVVFSVMALALSSLLPAELRASMLLAAGVVFLAWGRGVGQAEPMIPGGTLIGLGLAQLLVQLHLVGGMTDPVMYICLGIGILTVFPLSLLFTPSPQRWALLAGGVLAGLGVVKLLVATAPNSTLWGNWIDGLFMIALNGYGLWLVLRWLVGRRHFH